MANNNNNLNTNLSGNNAKGNNAGKTNAGNSNNELKNTTLIIIVFISLVILLAFVIIMIIIYVKTVRQNKIQDHVEEELLSYIHDCKGNPIDIAGSKIPTSTLGNEYSLNFWLYINSLE